MTNQPKKDSRTANRTYTTIAIHYQREIAELDRASAELNTETSADFVQHERLAARREQLIAGILTCLGKCIIV